MGKVDDGNVQINPRHQKVRWSHACCLVCLPACLPAMSVCRSAYLPASHHMKTFEMSPLPQAFRLLQLQTQYLLYSHQTLRERCIEVEKRLAKMQMHEAAAKRKTDARKERIRTLAAEAQAQDDVRTDLSLVTLHRSRHQRAAHPFFPTRSRPLF